MIEIRLVERPEQLQRVRELFEEYWNSFGFTPCFQGFGDEVAGLPGAYAPPDGRLVLASIDGEAGGCVALRRFDAERCEIKRLYIQPRFRGRGAGKALLSWMIEEARSAGYREMVGDTMPVMDQALALYGRAGFERTPPYSATPTHGAIYIRLRL